MPKKMRGDPEQPDEEEAEEEERKKKKEEDPDKVRVTMLSVSPCAVVLSPVGCFDSW